MTGTASFFPRASSPAARVRTSENPAAAPEAYSWGACDYESEGGCDGCQQGEAVGSRVFSWE